MSSTRIAKNTFFLYLRMAITMIISLYSSRILLKNLGVTDFGIYEIVGSMIAFFSSLRGLFASATQTFLNFEMGKKNILGLKKVFSTSLYIHLLVTAAFILVVGGLGYYFISFKLNIDITRLLAAKYVFFISLCSAIVSILSIPFDGVLIAREKFNIYALATVFESVLKLLIIVCLPFLPFDSLVTYSLLLFIVALIIRGGIVLYCLTSFDECSLKVTRDTVFLKNMGAFAGWQFFGNTSFYIVNEGTNLLLNVFFGPVVNAARAIAYQIKSAVMMFTSNIMTAANPQVIQLITSNNISKFYQLFSITNRIIGFAAIVVILPVFIFSSNVLELWLDVVPEYTNDFVRLILLYVLIRLFHSPLDSLFKAYGKIKKYQIVDSIILILTLPISYVFLKLYANANVVFTIMPITEIINLIFLLLLAKKELNFDLIFYYKKVILPIITVWSISVLLVLVLNYYAFGKVNFIILSVIYSLISLCVIAICGFSRHEKKMIISKIKNKL